jgi:rRNA maturation endonuclease Nob1
VYVGSITVIGGSMALYGVKNGRLSGQPRTMKRIFRSGSRPPHRDVKVGNELYDMIAGDKAKQAGIRKASSKMAEAASKQAGTKIAEAASKQAGTKIAEAASKQAGTKIAEAASKQAGTKIAEAAIGTGVSGAVEKMLKGVISCSNCGERLSTDSNFCSKCGHEIRFNNASRMSRDSKDQRRMDIKETYVSREGLSDGYPIELSRHERRKMFFEDLTKELSEMKKNKKVRDS